MSQVAHASQSRQSRLSRTSVEALTKCYLSFHADDGPSARAFIEQFESDTFRFRTRREGALQFASIDLDQPEPALLLYRNHHLRDRSTVIVLLSDKTYKSQLVDWDIAAGLLDYGSRRNLALCALTLPDMAGKIKRLPGRFRDNWNKLAGYACWFRYPKNAEELKLMIKVAEEARSIGAHVAHNGRELLLADIEIDATK